MRRRACTKRFGGALIFGVLIWLGTAPVGFAQNVQISFFGGMNHVFEYGEEEDYVLGENDFPVTPGHTPVNFGAAIAFYLSRNVGVEFDGRYILSSPVTLQDPSDKDTVEIDTTKHYSITLNVFYQFLGGKVKPYILAGGGIDRLVAEDKTYTTEFGYEVDFVAPEKAVDPMANIGAGIRFQVTRHFGIRLDLRYVIIFDEPNDLSGLNGVIGLAVGF